MRLFDVCDSCLQRVSRRPKDASRPVRRSSRPRRLKGRMPKGLAVARCVRCSVPRPPRNRHSFRRTPIRLRTSTWSITLARSVGFFFGIFSLSHLSSCQKQTKTKAKKKTKESERQDAGGVQDVEMVDAGPKVCRHPSSVCHVSRADRSPRRRPRQMPARRARRKRRRASVRTLLDRSRTWRWSMSPPRFVGSMFVESSLSE